VRSKASISQPADLFLGVLHELDRLKRNVEGRECFRQGQVRLDIMDAVENSFKKRPKVSCCDRKRLHCHFPIVRLGVSTVSWIAFTFWATRLGARGE
jgi:hypothetical protein